MVELRLYQEMRKVVGNNKIEFQIGEGKAIRDILKELVKRFPSLKGKIFDEKGKLNGYVNVFINGRNVMTKEGLDTTVCDEDRIALFPPVGGG